MIDLTLRTNLSMREMFSLQKHLSSKDLGTFMKEWHEGLWQVWALREEIREVDMMIVTAVHMEDEKRELFLYKIFGRGWIKNLDLMKQVLFVLAKEAKAEALTGVVRSRALGRLYERLGAEHISLNTYRMELSNGR